MKIIIKNNPKGKSHSELLTKIIEYYLNQLLGQGHKFGKLVIKFKRLPMGCGGRAVTETRQGVKSYLIEVGKYESKKEINRIIAHECTHIKQYFLNELTTKFELKFTGKRFIRKKVRNWKGKEIRRSVYKKRPWEVEARRGEKMACNILKKIDAPVEPKVITKPAPALVPVNNSVHELVMALLKDGAIPNGELVPKVLDGDKDKQKTLKVLREVFALKQSGVIQEYSEGSLIYVRRV